MAKSQMFVNLENTLEKIIFDDNELERLKIAIKNFTEGKTSAKDLKRLLLQCRGRMVEDITDFAFFFLKKRTADLMKIIKNKQPLPSQNIVESQLRKEIKEKNDLLETVAKRVHQLVSRRTKEDSDLGEDQKPTSIDEVKEEIMRCLTQIGANQWIKMCFYDDITFFVKLYPKLEALYNDRFGENENNSKAASEGKKIMANKMMQLGFPKDIEDIVINYISIRNNFHHSMQDISPSNLDLARDAFVKVFVYLIVSSLESKFLSKNRENFFSNLMDFFSNRLTGNNKFRKKIEKQLKIVINS